MGRNPKHPYAGISETIVTRRTKTWRFDHKNLRWRLGNTREPIIPNVGVMAPMRTRDEESMCRVVFPNKIAVEVIVVKPIK
jgi:hypothetical protein